ncbi:MAG: hypothetical protein LQ338_008142, partial [Usnochroma carphineum]
DDELPELSTLLAKTHVYDRGQRSQPLSPTKNAQVAGRSAPSTPSKKPKPDRPPTRKDATKKQRSLRSAYVDSLLLPFTTQSGLSPKERLPSRAYTRSKPRRALKSPVKSEHAISDFSSSESENAPSDHMSDFVVSDSEMDDSYKGYAKQRHPSPRRDRDQGVILRSPTKFTLPLGTIPMHREGSPGSFRKEALRKHGTPSRKGEQVQNRSSTTDAAPGNHDDSFEEPELILRLFGSRDVISPPPNRAVTPPISLTKAKLRFPTKRVHIPPSPHRPSIDAFWSQEVINDWNDQHSPKKTPKSILTRRFYPLGLGDEDDLSPCETGRRSPSKSPAKRDKQAAEKRKAFNEKKHDLAASFLKELDQTIVNGQITALAEATGGVRLVWSKTLQSTAGRANWKREAVRSKNPDDTVSTTKDRHHASIELAEKVIDDEDRLVNVIAHEYCHLLNFMISNVKDKPHGKEFKAWARKCSAAFAHRGVNVTTKHSYEIVYKYVWVCTHCGTEYKRHSKSIDPARHSCGKCKEKLVQVKPVPRGEGKGMGEYQRFVKERFAGVKKERPELTMGEVMAVLGKEFREMKDSRKEDVVVVEEKEAEAGDRDEEKDVGLDSVMRKLDFLNLSSG